MKIKINNIATIQAGYLFRGRVEPDPEGTHQVVQIKDVKDPDCFTAENLDKVTPERSVDRYIVNKGDVLFVAKGSRNFAVAITESVESTITSSNFFILKLNKENVLPEYLAWQINQPSTQKYLIHVLRRGTRTPLIDRSGFEKMTIDVPSLEIQSKIIQLHLLQKEEVNLLKKIAHKKQSLIHAVGQKLAKRE